MTEGSRDPGGEDDVGLTAAGEPFALFETWLADAMLSEINDPNAVAVATVDSDGMPNVRMVLLKGVDAPGVPDRGFVFYTNFEGTKGRELLAHPMAAMCFHWKTLERQIRVRGSVGVVTNAEADQYFASRPRLSRIGAWASKQSRPLEGRFHLETEVARYSAKYAVGEIPRPPHWSGFRLIPLEIEFWKSRPFRLHDRFAFRRGTVHAQWEKVRLFP